TLMLGGSLSIVSCQAYDSAARAQFAQTASCPAEKIEVTQHPGDPLPPGNPPPEVAADPGKLAIWRRDDQERREDSAATVYVAKGCGQEKQYTCGRSDRHASVTVCTEK